MADTARRRPRCPCAAFRHRGLRQRSTRTSSAASRDQPLSTFSIDVDTASYANVRRFLNEGTLPPADAVRVEELINYFRFDYADSTQGAPFAVTTELARVPVEPPHKLALVGLQAQPLTAGTHAAAQPRVPARRVGLDGRRPTSCRSSRPRCRCSPTRSTAARPRRHRRLRGRDRRRAAVDARRPQRQ